MIQSDQQEEGFRHDSLLLEGRKEKDLLRRGGEGGRKETTRLKERSATGRKKKEKRPWSPSAGEERNLLL